MCTLKNKSAEAEDVLRIPRHGMEAVVEMLKAINPYPFGNIHGICEACALEVASVLTTGRAPRQLVTAREQRELVNAAGDNTHNGRVGDDEIFEVTPDRGQRVWAWLNSAACGFGVVYIGRGGGHVWDILKDYDGGIHLFDMSTRFYKKVEGPDGAKGRYWWQFPWPRPEVPNEPFDGEKFRGQLEESGMIFNYINPTALNNPDRPVKLKLSPYQGTLNIRWAKLLRDSRHHEA